MGQRLVPWVLGLIPFELGQELVDIGGAVGLRVDLKLLDIFSWLDVLIGLDDLLEGGLNIVLDLLDLLITLHHVVEISHFEAKKVKSGSKTLKKNKKVENRPDSSPTEKRRIV